MPFQRFQREVRADVARYIGADPLWLQAVERHPGLAVALTYQMAPTGAALEAAEKTAAAGNFSAAAALLGLPEWTADLDASAFGKDLGDLPGGSRVDAALKSLVPKKPEDHRAFLVAVQSIARHADATAAVWLARAMRDAQVFLTEEAAAMVGFYTMMSRLPEGSRGAMQLAWSEEMDLATAARHTQSWVSWLALTARLGGADIFETWREGCEALGFEFRPVVNAKMCAEVARGLQNCVFQYAPQLLKNELRLFAVYKGSELVALAEVRVRNEGMLQCTQLKEVKNRRPPREVINAVHVFLGISKDVGSGGPTGDLIPAATPRAIEKAWSCLVAPYVAAKGQTRFVPVTANATALAKLMERASKLERVTHMDFMRRMLRDRA
jgi:hypothetical protein